VNTDDLTLVGLFFVVGLLAVAVVFLVSTGGNLP